jgi:hypothetical protein
LQEYDVIRDDCTIEYACLIKLINRPDDFLIVSLLLDTHLGKETMYLRSFGQLRLFLLLGNDFYRAAVIDRQQYGS